jgi:citrate synthase
MQEQTREPFHWRTSIAYKTRDEIVVRGYDLNELTGNIDFAAMAYLVWTGDLPSEPHRLMLNAMLVSLSEHAFSPSAASCRFVASGGVPLNTAVAGGVLTIGTRHGSADEAARMLQEGVSRCRQESLEPEAFAVQFVSEYRKERRTLNGYHHPQHIRDPRVVRLLSLAEELAVRGDHLRFARAIEEATEAVYGRRLYLNAPGAMAAIGSDMGLNPEQIKGLMILSRTVSLVAHSIEEMQREKGWRASRNSDITQPLDLSLQLPEYYDGPGKRSLPGVGPAIR